VPSCGIDSVPADISVHLASQTLAHAPLGTSTTSAALHGGVPTGTIASFLAVFEDVPLHLLLFSAHDWSLSPVPGARSPRPALVYRLGPGSREVGGVAVFNRVNRALVQRTAGLREYARREARLCGGGAGAAGCSGDPACYGPAFTYTEFMPTGNAVSACVLSSVIGLVFATLTFIAPVRVVFRRPHRTDPHRVLLSLFSFIGPVGVQTSDDADKLCAGRPVRTGHSSPGTQSFREELTGKHLYLARSSAVE
jgi:hypothetical protein